MNNVTIIGRITKDLEVRTTNNQKSVCEFTLAVNRTSSEGTDFINCIVWNKPAENLAKYQGKGSLIAVTGQLRVETYKGNDDKTRYKTYVLANNIEYLESKKQEAAPVKEQKEETTVTDPFEEYYIQNKEAVDGLDDSLPF